MRCLLKTTATTLNTFSLLQHMKCSKEEKTVQEKMLANTNYDQNSLLPIVFSSFAVFWVVGWLVCVCLFF